MMMSFHILIIYIYHYYMNIASKYDIIICLEALVTKRNYISIN
jgi:hypothetical protein